MKRIGFALLAELSSLLTGVGAVSAADRPPVQPIIMFTLVDNYGICGVGRCGGAFKTPNLDHAVVLKQPPSVITAVTEQFGRWRNNGA